MHENFNSAGRGLKDFQEHLAKSANLGLNVVVLQGSSLASLGDGFSLLWILRKVHQFVHAFIRGVIRHDFPVKLEELVEIGLPVRQQTGADARGFKHPHVARADAAASMWQFKLTAEFAKV